jgi:hypothetical protein
MYITNESEVSNQGNRKFLYTQKYTMWNKKVILYSKRPTNSFICNKLIKS